MPSPETTPATQARYEKARADIEDAYKKIYDQQAVFDAVVKSMRYDLPPVGIIDEMMSYFYRKLHVFWGTFENGDWDFDELAAHDMEVWEKIHQAFLDMSSYLEGMLSFGWNEETNEDLSSGAGGDAIRAAIGTAYHNAVLELNGLKQPDDPNKPYNAATNSRFPDMGPKFAKINRSGSGGTSGYALPWQGDLGQEYYSQLEPQELAAARLNQLATAMKTGVASVRSSYNDFLAQVKTFLVSVGGFLVSLTMLLVQIRREYHRAEAAALAEGLNPVTLAGTLAMIRQSFSLQLVAIITTINSVVVGYTSAMLLFSKNTNTLGPNIRKAREDYDSWVVKTDQLPNGGWPNPLGEAMFPEAAKNRFGSWAVAITARDRGLTGARSYYANRDVNTPWWNPPPP